MSVRVTDNFAVAYCTEHSTALVSQAHGDMMGQSNNGRRKISGVYTQAIGRQPLNTGNPLAEGANRVSVAWANVMIPFTPNFEWIEMFIYEVFPYDISYNSVGATRFSTDVVMVDSGHDQRSSRWDQPLMEYDIAYGVRTMEHLHGLIAFFRAMRGRKHAFLYHDYVDYRSTIAVDEETRIAPPTGPFDQQLGIGNHVTKSFQLVKRYPTPGGLLDQIRPIYKPEQGTVQVAVGGVEVTNYTVDYARGVITFVPNFTRTGLNAMTLAAVTDKWKISNAPAGTFTGLVVGDKVSTTGWLNPNNNVGEATPLVVTAVATDGTNFTYSAPAGYGEPETNRNGVSVIRHPAPKTGQVITAGFEFYVPVRFDTDRLPVSIEEYGIGGAADVKLVEVRPSEDFA